MTLPKGYKPNTPSRDDDGDNRPNSSPRPRKRKGVGKAIFFTILFFISLVFFVSALINYLETGKEVDEAEKTLDETRSEYEKTYLKVYGKLPPNSP